MTVGEVMWSLFAPYYQYKLVVLEVRRAVTFGNHIRGGHFPVHMGVGFANLSIKNNMPKIPSSSSVSVVYYRYHVVPPRC
jgi:hypothetical protein